MGGKEIEILKSILRITNETTNEVIFSQYNPALTGDNSIINTKEALKIGTNPVPIHSETKQQL